MRQNTIAQRYTRSLHREQDQTCTCYPPGGLPTSAELDSTYPYSNTNNSNPIDFVDSPRSPLVTNEAQAIFSATTYLMWDPALSSSGSCVPANTDQSGNSSQSTCDLSIPIPIGSISWSWAGDAVDTGSSQPRNPNNTDYILEPGCNPSESTRSERVSRVAGSHWKRQCIRRR